MDLKVSVDTQALARAIKELPNALQRRASGEVQQAGMDFYADMSARFPAKDVTGNLRASIRAYSTAPLRVYVQATAPHAHLYESGHTRLNGTRIKGANVWIPAAIENRRRMIADLQITITDAARDVGLS